MTLTVIAEGTAGLRRPTDLAFNPRGADELWIVNQTDDSVLIVFEASSAAPTMLQRKDGYALHFMDAPTSIAFGGDATTIGIFGTFATCQESRNTYNHSAPANDFMGPALWSSDLSVFAMHDPIGLGSHLDMLHGSPNCMGIAHERDSVYWAFGGKKQSGSTSAERQSPWPAIVKYDFGDDHGIGMDDHSDGEMYQYVTGEVARVEGIPSHMVFDAETNLLYVADTGNSRLAALDTTTGTLGPQLEPMEPVRAYNRIDNAVMVDVVPASSGLLQRPSGVELRDGLLFVSDSATGRITAFTKTGQVVNFLDTGLPPGALSGMAFGSDGKLYFVDVTGNRVFRIDPKQ